jgi:transposase
MKILAIDLGKAKSVACWYETTNDTHRMKTVCSTPEVFSEMLVEEPVERVVIEVCDMAGWVMDLGVGLGLSVQVANANTEGWRWRNVKKKTDRTDVLKLARMSAMNQLPEVYLPDSVTRQWRSLILYRHRLIERRTRIKNTIHALLVRQGKAMASKASMWEAAGLSKLKLLSRSLEKCGKEDLWRGHLAMELDNLSDLEKQIWKLDQKLNQIGDGDPRVIRVQTIPGVGPRLAELVAAVIDEPARFANSREISSYAGLVPRQYQSGQMDRSGRISKAGCGKLRKVLVQIAWGMLRNNERGAQVFKRVSKGQKSRRKQAAVALARRVLCWSWAMLRDGTDWRDPSKSRPSPQPAADPPGSSGGVK